MPTGTDPWLRELARLLLEAAKHPAKKPGRPDATMGRSTGAKRRTTA